VVPLRDQEADAQLFCATCGKAGHRAGECVIAVRELTVRQLRAVDALASAELVNAYLAEAWDDAARVATVVRAVRSRLARAEHR
jgi:hypothetical protein